MKNKILARTLLGMIIFGLSVVAKANLVVYYDQSNFLANAGAVIVYDFESDTPGYISSPSYSGGQSGAIQDFGDFSIDATSSGIYVAEIREQNGNNDITGDFYNNGASLNVIFDNSIKAFGYTYVAEGNDSYDHSTFSLFTNTWDLGRFGTTGFFGVIETTGSIAAGTPFSFGQQSINWSGVSFDNIKYAVPEPAILLIFGFILLVLKRLNIRKMKKN